MRLLDQFRAELDRRGMPMPGELFANAALDLFWPPCGDWDYVTSRYTEDPSITITGYTRYVTPSWVIDEIRFLASRIEPGDPPWWWSGRDPNRVAAVEAESDEI